VWWRRWRWQQSASNWATESGPDADPGTDSYSHTDPDPEPYSSSYTSAESDPIANSKSNSDSDSDADADADADSDPDVLPLPTDAVVPTPVADGLLLAPLEHPLANIARLIAPTTPTVETVEETRLMRTHLPGRLRLVDVQSPVQVDSEWRSKTQVRTATTEPCRPATR